MEHDFPFSDDRSPMARLGPVPVTITNLVLGLNAAAILTLLIYAGFAGQKLEAASALLQLDTRGIAQEGGWVRILTYPFAETSWTMFCTVISLFVFYFAGNQIEEFLGRKTFAWLLAALWFIPACFIVALFPFEPNAVYGGTGAFYLGVVFTLSLLFPNAQVFMKVEARWAGLALVAGTSLMALANGAWTLLLAVVVTCLTSVVFLRRLGLLSLHSHFTAPAGSGRFLNESYYQGSVPEFLREHERMRKMDALETRSFEGVGTRSKTQRAISLEQLVEEEPEDVYDVIDPLLEKIAQGGITSLTQAERDRLESARQRLMEGEKH